MSRHLERGHLLLSLGRDREAASEFAKQAVLPGEGQAEALALLALTEMDGGSLDLAAGHLAQARMQAPTLPIVCWAGAVHAARKGDLKRMGRELLGMRLSAPSDPDLIGRAAALHAEAGDLKHALELATEGLAIDPNHEDCLNAAASAAAGLGKESWENAFADRLLHLNPQLGRAHSLLARRAMRDNDLASAGEHARTALRLEPNEIAAHGVLLRVRSLDTFIFRLLEGRIGKWRMPFWLRVVMIFLPKAAAILLPLSLGREILPPWFDRLTNPFVLAAIWVAAFLGWNGWYAFAHAIRDRNARRVVAANQGELLVTTVPPTLVTLTVMLYVVAGIAAFGVMAGASILGFALLAVLSRYPDRSHRGLCFTFGGLFLLCVAGEVAIARGIAWAGPALVSLILTLAAALFALLMKFGSETSSPPPLPRLAHVPPPLPR